METLIQQCRQCQKNFPISSEDQEFFKKMEVPPPTLCPEDRMQRRLMFRNERNLYHRKCDLSGRAIISYISPDKPYKVYDQKEWWSDKWDPRDYGRGFDFNRPFFDQFNDLLLVTPYPHVISASDIQEANCLYTNFAGNNKNCYLIFDSDFNEDCQYSNVLKHSKNCLDCSYVSYSELLYECMDCHNCYNLKYSQDSTDCFDSLFLKNCSGCKNCIACVNLRQQEFCIFNKKYSKEDYEKFLRENDLGDQKVIKKLQEEFEKHVKIFPVKYNHSVLTENSNGDYLKNTQNVSYSFNMGMCRDCKYSDSLYHANDCMDTSSFGEKIELVYESTTVGVNSNKIRFSNCIVNDSYDVTYSFNCHSAKNIFGCANMKRGTYCILNKEYTKEDYETLVLKIIEHMKKTGEWGEFFPPSLSPFSYNETVAQEYFPLSKEEAFKKGYCWKEEESVNTYQGQTIQIPAKISDLSDSVLGQILTCKESGKFYKLTPHELQFYRQMNLPAPLLCPNQRHLNRMQKRNPRKLWDRACQNCNSSIRTTYAPDRPEKVLCEACYLNTVY